MFEHEPRRTKKKRPGYEKKARVHTSHGHVHPNRLVKVAGGNTTA